MINMYNTTIIYVKSVSSPYERHVICLCCIRVNLVTATNHTHMNVMSYAYAVSGLIKIHIYPKGNSRKY